jgi:G3E family GTPase
VNEPAIIKLALPPALVTRADLSRLVRDIEAIDNELEAQKARNHATGQSGYHVPTFSKSLADFAELNKLDLADDQLRMLLKDQMKVMKEKAPVLHMTFAVEADAASLGKIIEYVRKEIHPQALLSVGLQPALVGGVYLRTPNHVHDFSVRGRLASAHSVIAQDIEALTNVIEVVPAPPEEPDEIEPATAAPAPTPQGAAQ